MKKDFESRFMPNVKFTAPQDMINDFLLDILYSAVSDINISRFPVGAVTSNDGSIIKTICNSTASYSYFNGIKKVSIYEAMPELISDGMRYNKELDKLVPDVISASDEYCSGIKIDLKEDLITNHRAYNIGSSNYASLKIQPWDIWKDWKLDPWDADIIKRISRTKEIPGKSFEEARIEDYEKIKHVCDEKIYQLREKSNVK
jgi:hypothetical protein